MLPPDDFLRHSFLRIAAGGQAAETALGDLYARSHKCLYRIFRRFNDEHSAQELVHDLFVRMWRKPGRLALVNNPRGWLLRVARNLRIEHGRWRRSRTGTLSMDDEDCTETHERVVEKLSVDAADAQRWRDEIPVVDRALEIMRRRSRRRYLALVYKAKGLSGAEVAQELGIAQVNTANQLVAEARRELRTILAELSGEQMGRRALPQ